MIKNKVIQNDHFNDQQQKSIEESAKSGNFWRKLPGNSKKSKTIPIKIKNPDGSTSYNIQDVLNKWKHDFSVMYNYDAEAGYVSQELLNQNAMKETEIIQNEYECILLTQVCHTMN